MSDETVPEILVSPSRRMAAEYPWFEGVLGSCIALRRSRAVAAVLFLPALVLDLIKFPGTGPVVRFLSPVGQLAYSRSRAALGYPYSTISEQRVDKVWVSRVERYELVSKGWIFARVRVNDELVFIDRRCADALIELWRDVLTASGARNSG